MSINYFSRIGIIAILLPIVFFTYCSVENKAAKIHRRVMTVDAHTDTPLRLQRSEYDIGARHESGREGGLLDLPRMKEGGLDAAFFAAFVGQGPRDEGGYEDAKNRVLEILDSIYHAVSNNSDQAGIATTPDDAYRLEREGKRAIFIGMENGYPVGRNLSLLQRYHDLGVRYITLCHIKNNDICDSSTDDEGSEHGGLSEFGAQVVREMNRLGIMVDVAHISDDAVKDVLDVSNSPVIASHSCARAICENPRNLNDELLRMIAENGGVIQVCMVTDYVKKIGQHPAREEAETRLRDQYKNYSAMSDEEKELLRKEWDRLNEEYPKKLASMSDFVDHIDHIVKVAGIDHVGIGSDFDGGGVLDDCRDVSRFGAVTLELVKRGYSERDIEKIWGGNLMGIFADVEKRAETPDASSSD